MATASQNPAVEAHDLTHKYGDRTALDRLQFNVHRGEIFGLLGPNGGGKTTLFRILSTLQKPSSGSVRVLGKDPVKNPDSVRREIGLVFQSFSLDKILSVEENLLHQGRLYGLSGRELRNRVEDRLGRVGLLDRKDDRVSELSGGMQRRVEVAKGMLHDPSLLLMDEPSTGLDPGARLDLWRYLRKLRDEDACTILLTTHLMEEAEKCDRLGILSRGRMVALGTPDELKSRIGGEVVTVQTENPEQLAERLARRFAVKPSVIDNVVRLELKETDVQLERLMSEFSDSVQSITVGKPTLEDVFVHETGHRFWEEEKEE